MQPCPGPKAWKQWNEIILWMYAQTNSTKLSKPLGPWNQHYNSDYNWKWMVNPRTHQLYHQYQQVWHTYQPECWKPMEIIYPMQLCIIRKAPANTVPATRTFYTAEYTYPYQSKWPPTLPRRQLHLNKHCCKNWLCHPQPGKDCYGTIYNQWQILDNWNCVYPSAKQLCWWATHWYCPMVKGSCVWTIWSQTHLWQGSRHVPGPNLDMYLGLAEAYSMYSALSFLQQYLATFPLVLPTEYGVQVYCDNKGLVNQLNCNAIPQYPCDTIMDDYPIIGEI